MKIQDSVVATVLAADPAQPFEPGLSADPSVSLRARV
jgi:hypothetical protein